MKRATPLASPLSVCARRGAPVSASEKEKRIGTRRGFPFGAVVVAEIVCDSPRANVRGAAIWIRKSSRKRACNAVSCAQKPTAVESATTANAIIKFWKSVGFGTRAQKRRAAERRSPSPLAVRPTVAQPLSPSTRSFEPKRNCDAEADFVVRAKFADFPAFARNRSFRVSRPRLPPSPLSERTFFDAVLFFRNKFKRRFALFRFEPLDSPSVSAKFAASAASASSGGENASPPTRAASNAKEAPPSNGTDSTATFFAAVSSCSASGASSQRAARAKRSAASRASSKIRAAVASDAIKRRNSSASSSSRSPYNSSSVRSFNSCSENLLFIVPPPARRFPGSTRRRSPPRFLGFFPSSRFRFGRVRRFVLRRAKRRLRPPLATSPTRAASPF